LRCGVIYSRQVVFHKKDTGGQKPKETHTPSDVQSAEWRTTMINRLEHASQSHLVDPLDGFVCDTLVGERLCTGLGIR
jgi:hypothetical protein